MTDWTYDDQLDLMGRRGLIRRTLAEAKYRRHCAAALRRAKRSTARHARKVGQA